MKNELFFYVIFAVVPLQYILYCHFSGIRILS